MTAAGAAAHAMQSMISGSPGRGVMPLTGSSSEMNASDGLT